ncbi:MAG TPA: HAMP domain-containing protein [Spirochaetes bacterium]|nr:HAMP domain-containing protein [Spirochaetota bacterium]
MDLKSKIMVILGVCMLLCVSSYFLIVKMFDNLETQLFEKCRIEAFIGAKVTGETINLLIDSARLSEKDAFDTTYIPIPNTSPQKYTTRYDRLLDRYLQGIIDEFLKDPDIDYAVPVDINGYVPTHNSRYSVPSTGDQGKNLWQSRSKRIFDDPVGITAARHRGEGTIKQLYNRDTGETMWDISAPIRVRGNHWGAFRVGVSLQRVEGMKNQMVILIGMSLLVILSITMLILFLIIPRKLYDTDLDIPKY